jgi:ribonuclease Y
VRDIKDQAKRNADREARRIISIAIQRLAAEHTAETTGRRRCRSPTTR